MVKNVSVILLFNEKIEVLLQQRALDAKRAPGKWGFFGGDIEKVKNLDLIKYDKEILFDLKDILNLK